MKYIISFFTSMRTMLLFLVIFAFSIAIATFVENDFGNDAARKLIYNARWFEILLILGMINIVAVIFKQRLYRPEKLTLFVFHVAFVVVIFGAGITRYFGKEGIVHIRVGDTAKSWITTDTYLELLIEKNGHQYSACYPVLFSEISKNRFRKKISFEGSHIHFSVKSYIRRAEKGIDYKPGGKPFVHMITASGLERIITSGEKIASGDVSMFFSDSGQDSISSDLVVLNDKNGVLTFTAPYPVIRTSMDEGISDTLEANQKHRFVPFMLYNFHDIPFVLRKYLPEGQIIAKPATEQDTDLPSAVKVDVDIDGVHDILFAWGKKEQVATFTSGSIHGVKIGIRYGAVRKELPFALKLKDFIIQRYPGSQSPSWFESNVQLIDQQKGIGREERIYMNHVLKYRGYKFYQSSYDSDEKGTVLSLNRDGFGTAVTYSGYLLLALGMLLSLVNKKSRFRKLSQNRSKANKVVAVFFPVLLFLCANSYSQTGKNSISEIPAEHADEFCKILVQDNGGRIEPLNTLASEIVRKVTRKESYKGQSANQVFTGMLVYPEQWQQEPFIKTGHPEIQKLIGVGSKYASFLDFFPARSGGNYILRPYIEEAYRKKPAFRDKFDNEIIRVDERVNICYMVYRGTLLKIFPDPADTLNTWHSFATGSEVFKGEDSLFAKQIFRYYIEETRKSMESDDWTKPSEIVGAIGIFQQSYGQPVIPSDARLKAETFYNDFNIFSRITRMYLFAGFLLLVFQFLHIFIPRFRIKYISVPVLWIIALVFLLHTSGLALRWYVAGHAPWSNGYEALIFIAWATVFAGLLFSRKSGITVSATAILAALILQTAHLSWMDPQITNLVPVLKSYWLIVHVAVITASYGFLGLGALIAFLNLLLLFSETKKNKNKLEQHITGLTQIIEMTLIAGLYLLTIGTFLGGVWANESWGRYWGWDPKETWALVTVIVYAVILHLRLVPGFKGRVLFNIVSLTGFGSVIMTYFGVNYYLSGLHSYAQGDPLPLPPLVYYSLAVVVVVSSLAVINQYRLNIGISEDT